MKPLTYHFEINMCFHLVLYDTVNIRHSTRRPYYSLSSFLCSLHLRDHCYASKVEAMIHIQRLGPFFCCK
jgi:hypothetical protein